MYNNQANSVIVVFQISFPIDYIVAMLIEDVGFYNCIHSWVLVYVMQTVINP